MSFGKYIFIGRIDDDLRKGACRAGNLLFSRLMIVISRGGLNSLSRPLRGGSFSPWTQGEFAAPGSSDSAHDRESDVRINTYPSQQILHSPFAINKLNCF
jgi:hypothetical protein